MLSKNELPFKNNNTMKVIKQVAELKQLTDPAKEKK